MRLRLDPVAVCDVRRNKMRRLNPPGIGIHYRRRRALVDLWLSAEGVIFARLSTGQFRRWRRVVILSGRAPSDPDQFTEALRHHLDDWFYNILDSSED